MQFRKGEYKDRRTLRRERAQRIKDRALERSREGALEELERRGGCAAKEPRGPKPAGAPPAAVRGLERIDMENKKRREEARERREAIEKTKEEKRNLRKRWSEKFGKRTRKGQVPLDHRINYALAKIVKREHK